MKQEHNKKVLEEFDKFSDTCCVDTGDDCFPTYLNDIYACDDIKQFITDKLDEQAKLIVEKLKDYLPEQFDCNQCPIEDSCSFERDGCVAGIH